jgi:hypothetical protein
MESPLETAPGPGPETPERRGQRCLLLSGFREELRALMVLAGPAVSLVASVAGWSRQDGSLKTHIAMGDLAEEGTERACGAQWV